MSFCVYSGTYNYRCAFENDFGFENTQTCESEAAAILYMFNKWPRLRLAPYQQVGRANRTVVWILADGDQREPCAAMVNIVDPLFKPNWELWRPYLRKDDDNDE